MTLVTSSAWLSEAEERKALRDRVRANFYRKIGVAPVRSLSDVVLSPFAQAATLPKLISQANALQGDPQIAQALAELETGFSAVGLGRGGAMARAGETRLDTSALVVRALASSHFRSGG